MVLRHGATASIGRISHVRKLAMPFAKYEITAYGIGVALTDMTFIQSLVKFSQLLPASYEGHTEITQYGLFAVRERLRAEKGTTLGL
jgi:hypothetical protein